MKNSIFLVLIIVIASCSTPTPRKPIVRKTSTFLKESIERNKVINQVEEQALLDYIHNDSLNTYITSPNGFWYRYNTKSSLVTKLPVKGDEIMYAFEIKDVNNEILYTKEELGDRNYLVDREELISGLQEGLKLMKEGEEVLFLFPSYKAYGYSGYKKIAGNQPLVYTVEVKKITSNK
jgi:gliding motility-associated peptidyl-prolyl isomerase